MAEKFTWEKDEKTKKASTVGQAVYDILAKDSKEQTVEEIMAEYAPEYTAKIEETIRDNVNRYDPPFYIVVLTKKEPWALNVMRNWFVARQTKPLARVLRRDYPNHLQTVYSFNGRNGELKLLWSLPTALDCLPILKNKAIYDPQLVKWIEDFNNGFLDLD